MKSLLLASLLLGSSALGAYALKPVGTGTYRDNVVSYFWPGTVDPTKEWNVEITESETTPGLYYIENPFDNAPFISSYIGIDRTASNYIEVHAEDPDNVYLGLSNTGLTWQSVFNEKDENGQVVEVTKPGYLMMYSVAGYDFDNVHGELDPTAVGKLRDGNIFFPAGTILGFISPEVSAAPSTLWLQTNSEGLWRLRMPGALKLDASCTLTQEDDQLTVKCTMEDDVDLLRVGLAPGKNKADAIQAVMDGTVPYGEINHDKAVTLTIPGTGDYVVVLLPYHDGVAKTDFAYCEPRQLAVDDGTWVRCAKDAEFYCNIFDVYTLKDLDDPSSIWPIITLSPWKATAPVEYLRSDATKVRLVEPFSPESGNPYANEENYDKSTLHYWEFDLSDPEQVTFSKMPSVGFTANNGNMALKCKALHVLDYPTYGITKGSDAYIALCGKLNGSELTWPVEGDLLVDFTERAPGKWYWGDRGQKTGITFPQEVLDAVSGIETAGIDTANAPAEYYSLQGIRLSEPPAHGLYIECRGARAMKRAR